MEDVLQKQRFEIRLATAEDAGIIHTGLVMIARHLKAEGKVTSTIEDIRRHGFGSRPAFEVLIAEVDATVGGTTPLCHFVTSPPQGGSLEARGIPQPISPLEGEMPVRAEGGDVPMKTCDGASKVFAGMCLFFPSFSTWRGQKGAYIQDIVVDERFRGFGVGVALVRHTAAHVRAEGGTYLRLSVDAENVSAQHFYERLGLSWSRDEHIHAAYGDAFQMLAGQHESGV